MRERIPEAFRLDPIRGSLGVRELSLQLQKVLNPARAGEAAVVRFGWRSQVRDKVIQRENDYDKDVFNGDVGVVEEIDMVEQEVTIRFDDRQVTYDFGELDEVSLAYLVTVVVQALRHLGRTGVGVHEIDTLRGMLSLPEKRRLVNDTRFGTGGPGARFRHRPPADAAWRAAESGADESRGAPAPICPAVVQQ